MLLLTNGKCMKVLNESFHVTIDSLIQFTGFFSSSTSHDRIDVFQNALTIFDILLQNLGAMDRVTKATKKAGLSQLETTEAVHEHC